MTTKICCRCRLPKEVKYFHRSRTGLYSVHSICKDCKKIYMADYNKSGKLKISKIKYKITEKGKATIRAYTRSDANKKIQKNYTQTPAGRLSKVSRLANYRATKKSAMPQWVSVPEIKKVYKKCPKGLEVDHIIPIQGKNISGLHVPWNLQYLTREENAVKSNSFDGTYENDSWQNE